MPSEDCWRAISDFSGSLAYGWQLMMLSPLILLQRAEGVDVRLKRAQDGRKSAPERRTDDKFVG